MSDTFAACSDMFSESTAGSEHGIGRAVYAVTDRKAGHIAADFFDDTCGVEAKRGREIQRRHRLCMTSQNGLVEWIQTGSAGLYKHLIVSDRRLFYFPYLYV